MSSKGVWFVVWLVLYVTPWPHVHASGNYTRYILNSVIYDDAFKILHRPRTGRLYNVSLPLNMSGIQVSVVRLRARRLWLNGVNFSSFEIPARILPWPFSKRVDIVYQNLGNWSSYFSVANHTIVAPVLGLLAYDNSNTSSINNRLVELNITDDNPIIVRFSNISSLSDVGKCVWFGTNGVVELSKMTVKSSCVARGIGHYAIVVPYEPINSKSSRKRRIWWMVGLAIGVVGLMLLILLGLVMYKLIIREKMKKMEKESERSEVLDRTWIGVSRMPSASGIRTQPVIEDSYLP